MGSRSLIPAVFAATFRILRRLAFFIPAIVMGVAADVTMRANGWPGADIRVWPSEGQFTTAILVVLARGWFDLTLIAVAIAIVREQPAGIGRQWVHVLRALKIGIVSLCLLAGVLLGTLALIVPGVYLLLRWSQALPAMIEGRTGVSHVLMYSEAIASAHYLRILVIWAATWGAAALVALSAGYVARALEAHTVVYFRHIAIGSDLAWAATLHALNLALVAALYVELDTRAYVRVRHIG